MKNAVLCLLIVIGLGCSKGEGDKYQGKTMNDWLKLAESFDENTRVSAFAALSQMGRLAEGTVPALLEAVLWTALERVNTQQADDRESAAFLALFPGAAVPLLSEGLREDNPRMRIRCVTGLYYILMMPRFVAQLRSDYPDWGFDQLDMSHYGPDAVRPAAENLQRLLTDQNTVARQRAHFILQAMRHH